VFGGYEVMTAKSSRGGSDLAFAAGMTALAIAVTASPSVLTGKFSDDTLRAYSFFYDYSEYRTSASPPSQLRGHSLGYSGAWASSSTRWLRFTGVWCAARELYRSRTAVRPSPY
jgi:hypothetical protein